MAKSCDLCQVGTESYRVINQTELITSFLSTPRLVRGHSLVIPNRHSVPPAELTDEEVLAMRREGDRLRKAMLGSFALGVDRFQKTRPFVGQAGIKRDHEHEHIIPSSPSTSNELYETGIIWGKRDHFYNSEGASVPALWQPLTPKEAATMTAILRPQS